MSFELSSGVSKQGSVGETVGKNLSCIYNSYGLLLASHEPFENTRTAIIEEKDILTTTVVLEHASLRIRVGDTDVGRELKRQIEKLELLLYCYENGILSEQS